MFSRLKNKLREQETVPEPTILNGQHQQQQQQQHERQQLSESLDSNAKDNDDDDEPHDSVDSFNIQRENRDNALSPAAPTAHTSKLNDAENGYREGILPAEATTADTSTSSSIQQQQQQYDVSFKGQLQQMNDSLIKQIDDLTNEYNEKLNENEELRSQILKMKLKFEDTKTELSRLNLQVEQYKLSISNYEEEMRSLSKSKDDLIIRNAELSEKYEHYKVINFKQNQQNHINHQASAGAAQSSAMPINAGGADLAGIDGRKLSANRHTTDSATLDEHTEMRALRDELSEKNKLIKNLQQRLNDMKKTLLKELKYQALPNELTSNNNTNSPQLSPRKPSTHQATANGTAASRSPSISSLIRASNPSKSQSNSPPSSGQKQLQQQQSPTTSTTTSPKHTSRLMMMMMMKKPAVKSSVSLNHSTATTGSNTTTNNNNSIRSNNGGTALTSPTRGYAPPQLTHLHDDVNFKYLKHVVLRFVTSREYEAVHLVKAMSVLLNFSHEEEKILRESLEWKMSWFGTRPRFNYLH